MIRCRSIRVGNMRLNSRSEPVTEWGQFRNRESVERNAEDRVAICEPMEFIDPQSSDSMAGSLRSTDKQASGVVDGDVRTATRIENDIVRARRDYVDTAIKQQIRGCSAADERAG